MDSCELDNESLSTKDRNLKNLKTILGVYFVS
jgi:hypothetical protein